ncbi:MAG: hypothetical protein V8T10_06345 [Merdibacter sp.]
MRGNGSVIISLLKAQDWYARIPFLKPAQRVIIPLMVSGILMLVLPQVLGS